MICKGIILLFVKHTSFIGGAPDALCGLVGAWSAFILVHRQAFRSHGIPARGWLILVIGMNRGLGLLFLMETVMHMWEDCSAVVCRVGFSLFLSNQSRGDRTKRAVHADR
jgi:hypothetical protein